MAGDGSARDDTWTRPRFSFNVGLGDGRTFGFSEVSGIGSEAKAIADRPGDGAAPSSIEMPGRRSIGNVTLKKGVLAKDSIFWNWLDEARSNAVRRRTVIINLVGEDDVPRMTWRLTNAFPVKSTATDLGSDADEVALDSLEICYETLAVEVA